MYSANCTPAKGTAPALLWPEISTIAGLPASLSALLPNRNHNAVLADLIARLPPADETPHLAPLFLADPFFNLKSYSTLLKTHGIRRVAALPSVQQYGASFETTLDRLHLGLQREQDMLLALQLEGFMCFQTQVCNQPLPPVSYCLTGIIWVPSFERPSPRQDVRATQDERTGTPLADLPQYMLEDKTGKAYLKTVLEP
ncbi:phosphoenolpyruvate hydrolase family protein [Pseudovibrio exalbescens]|uniref:phosphoenolpyruvate hydrolase family protein n=1 Tax=Pseudovibrio exalbescens TaxID=197461 RepID=UPI000C9CBAB1|nr:phosphoenolpyruvate hydrolase family protein [Pseudovibrio exalbescens]